MKIQPKLLANRFCLVILLVTSAFLLSSCGNPQESARKGLVKLNKDFSPDAFIDSVGNGDKQAVKLFLEAGIDVNAAIGGATALDIAAMKGEPEMVKMLLDHGADPNLAMATGGGKGVTPLMAVAAGGHAEAMKLLLDKGAAVNAKDDEGLIALDYAGTQANLDIMKMLWAHGAPFVTEAALTKLLVQFRRDVHNRTTASIIAHQSPDDCRKFIEMQLQDFAQQERFTTNQIVEARACAFQAVSDVVDKFAMNEHINATGAIGTNEQNRESIRTFAEFLKELQSDPAK